MLFFNFYNHCKIFISININYDYTEADSKTFSELTNGNGTDKGRYFRRDKANASKNLRPRKLYHVNHLMTNMLVNWLLINLYYLKINNIQRIIMMYKPQIIFFYLFIHFIIKCSQICIKNRQHCKILYINLGKLNLTNMHSRCKSLHCALKTQL